VTVTETNKSVMVKDSALEVIKKRILGGKRPSEDEEEATTNKKRRNNTAAVPTGLGQNGLGAVQFTNGRDVRQNKEARRKKIASLKAEAKTINKTLAMIKERKARCELEWDKMDRLRREEATAAAASEQQHHRERTNDENGEGALLNLPRVEIMSVREERFEDSHFGPGTADTSGLSTDRTDPTGATVARPTVVADCTFPTTPSEVYGEPRPGTGDTVARPPVVAPSTFPTTPLEVYWEPRPTSNQDDLKLFLRLFEPNSGALSKKKSLQWEFVREKIVPRLSEAAFIAKEQAIRRRLDATDGELAQLAEVEEETGTEEEDDIDETEERLTTETDTTGTTTNT
jgi:hypothetical protein